MDRPRSRRRSPGAVGRPQDETLATYAPRLRKEEAEIDWSRSAAAIERQIRAFHPAPGAHTRLGGNVLKIWRAAVERDTSGAVPGTVRAADSSGIVVSCGDGALRIIELQRAGGKRLSAAAFLAGAALAAGMRIGTWDG